MSQIFLTDALMAKYGFDQKYGNTIDPEQATIITIDDVIANRDCLMPHLSKEYIKKNAHKILQPQNLYWYAKELRGKLSDRQELLLSTDPVASYNYAVVVLKKPFDLGEEAIDQMDELKARYKTFKKQFQEDSGEVEAEEPTKAEGALAERVSGLESTLSQILAQLNRLGKQ